MSQVNQPEDLLDRIARLERELADVRKRSGTGNAVCRGAFRFFDENGNEQIYFGVGTFSGGTSAGWVMRRASGASVFDLGGNPANQFWALRDEAANILISDDAATGQGLARPYLAGGQFGSLSAPTDTTSGGVFVALQKAIWRKQHPRIEWTVLANVTSTTAEFRFRIASGPDAGTVLFGPQTLGTGFGYAKYGPVTLPGAHLSEFDIDIEGRVASGVGLIGVRVLAAMGIQS